MKKEDLRIVFMGTPEFAVATLDKLIEEQFNVVAVVTQPDKPVGRHGSMLQPSPVKTYACSKKIPVLQPIKMKDEAFQEELRSYNADIQVVVAFRMLPESVWDMPPYGTFNVHASLLPQYRGAAPINWAIINGEEKTGVTTFFLDHKIDTGRMILQKEFDIPVTADVEYVYDGLMNLGAQAAVDTLIAVIEHGKDIPTTPQKEDEELHSAPKIFKDTCKINWNQSDEKVYNFVRGLSPYPGVWTLLYNKEQEEKGKEEVLKIFKTMRTDETSKEAVGTIVVDKSRILVATTNNYLSIEELQLAGKRKMNAKDFLNGFKNLEQYILK
ncbi:MAG: methionyl-tRNA formyltransferase [Prevotella sp.]